MMVEGWTIYQHTGDFPYAVRKHYGIGHSLVFAHASAAFVTLDRARESLPRGLGLMKFPRTSTDDPRIVETWLTPLAVNQLGVLSSAPRRAR